MTTLWKCVTWVLAPWLGRDGKPSRTMAVITAVIGSYWAKRPVPELVGVFAILATFGIKAILAWIEKSSSTLTTATQIQLGHTVAKTETRTETTRPAEGASA